MLNTMRASERLQKASSPIGQRLLLHLFSRTPNFIEEKKNDAYIRIYKMCQSRPFRPSLLFIVYLLGKGGILNKEMTRLNYVFDNDRRLL